MSCVLCMVDAHECSTDERLAAHLVIGMVMDDVAPCPEHTKMMITGAAVIAEAKGGHADAAKEIRRIAAHEPLRVVPAFCDCYDDGVMPVLGPGCQRHR